MAFKECIFSHFPHQWMKLEKDGTNRLMTTLENIFDWVASCAAIPMRNNLTGWRWRRGKIIMKKRMIDCPMYVLPGEAAFRADIVQSGAMYFAYPFPLSCVFHRQ